MSKRVRFQAATRQRTTPTDTAVNISSLGEDASVRVYVLADVPLTATNGQFANVQLAAQAANNGTSDASSRNRRVRTIRMPSTWYLPMWVRPHRDGIREANRSVRDCFGGAVGREDLRGR